MRFRLWLPLLQTIAMLLITWAPWSPEAHRLTVGLPGERQISAWTLVPRPNIIDPFDFSEGINLPAAAVVVPIEFAARQGGSWMNTNFRFFGFWIAGLLCWYMAGRFVDDVIDWRRSRLLPRKNSSDIAFALLAVPSSILLASVFLFSGGASRILVVASAVWLVLSAAALIFRLAQIIAQRRKPKFS
jgi:hypothetical protein